jgi:hypothetical protein
MSNYKKFSLDTIKQKLKNGEYAAPVGAMRAIGKTQELSEADKEKARKLVRAHFGIVEGAKPAPKAKKAAKKAGAKKTAKKAAKAAGTKKKAARKKASKKAAPAAVAAPEPKPVAKKASKKASKKSKAAVDAPEGDTTPSEAPAEEVAKSSPASQAESSKRTVINEMGEVIATVSESLKAMEAAKRIFPKAALERNVEMVTGAMTRAVRVIDEEVTKPRLGEAPGTTSSAAAPVRKKGSKKGTRAKAQTTPPPSEEEAAEPALPNGAHAESELSEEEQEQLRLARETQPQVD